MFSTVAGMRLCFRFVLGSAGNTGMFSLLLSTAHIEPRPFLLLTSPHQRGDWRYTGNWKRTQPGQLTPADPRSYHRASWSAHKEGSRRRKGSTFRVMEFTIPSYCYMGWSPDFLGMAEHLSAHGKRWMNSLICFAGMCSLCFTYYICLSPWEFFLLLPSQFSPTVGNVSEWLCEAQLLSGGFKPDQGKNLKSRTEGHFSVYSGRRAVQMKLEKNSPEALRKFSVSHTHFLFPQAPHITTLQTSE